MIENMERGCDNVNILGLDYTKLMELNFLCNQELQLYKHIHKVINVKSDTKIINKPFTYFEYKNTNKKNPLLLKKFTYGEYLEWKH